VDLQNDLIMSIKEARKLIGTYNTKYNDDEIRELIISYTSIASSIIESFSNEA